jgi:indole-3-glycerol phosphate synthase
MLNEIVARKRAEVAQRKKDLPLSALEERIGQQETLRDFAVAIKKGAGVRLIAEVKRASPSRGLLRPDFDPVALAQTYAAGGAAAISVLTEANYFQGSLDHLTMIRAAVTLPLLRKDFIFDPYQVYESRAHCADALLLIVAILSREQLGELLSLSHGLGLSCLVEVHCQSEVESAVASGARIIGINNRDLATFEVDIDTTRRLRSLIPRDRIVVSESGISGQKDVQKLQAWSVNAMLIGEALVTAADVPAKLKELTR